MKNIILEANNIKKRYDKEAVLDLDNIKIFESAFNFLIGPNGSGKTTLLNILSLVDTDFKGEVIYKGQPVKKVNFDLLDLRRNFSVIWQNPYLFKGSVASNIALPLKLRNVKEDEIASRVENIAKKLEITNLLNKKSDELSGGERQKTSIARSLITNPEILFIDEPNISLDYQSTQYFNDLFLRLTSEGTTILLITHDLYQINNFAEYITILNDGKVVKSGSDIELDY
ncbi:MAG TPA: ABC transporter ATP-binding protein [Halanaerobiales bacterium]|nr:ABC transporter ATP-binding protein [Halanaerobiales bacterium]